MSKKSKKRKKEKKGGGGGKYIRFHIHRERIDKVKKEDIQ